MKNWEKGTIIIIFLLIGGIIIFYSLFEEKIGCEYNAETFALNCNKGLILFETGKENNNLYDLYYEYYFNMHPWVNKSPEHPMHQSNLESWRTMSHKLVYILDNESRVYQLILNDTDFYIIKIGKDYGFNTTVCDEESMCDPWDNCLTYHGRYESRNSCKYLFEEIENYKAKHVCPQFSKDELTAFCLKITSTDIDECLQFVQL